MKRQVPWLVFAALSACADDTRVLESEPSDASFLVGLRTVGDFGASTEGVHGTLIPRAIFDQIEPLTRVDEPDDIYANLDVVAVRLDPCFFEGTGEPVCSSQVRLVLQPVFDGDDGVVSRDATLHAFYAVPTDELVSLLDQLVEIRQAASGGASVGEHADPQSAAEAVLPYVGADRLTRTTFVAVHASNQAWTFGGLDFVDGSSIEIEPPGTEDHEQHLTSTGGMDTLDASILPAPTIEPALNGYLEEALRLNLGEVATSDAMDALSRLMSPTDHNPGTVDCASCHMATPALHFAASSGAFEPPPDAYANSQNQRMLGYFDATPSISPRVVAETDVVVDFFHSNL